ncbi:MAG: hypothetical protein K9J79_03780 [Desulfobacteraceae bacterium]|nr:hypothetical protein [Desulfobacteraceae bacterium]
MKINISNKDKVQEAIDKAEAGCSARLIDDDIDKVIEKAEEKLAELRILKKHWNGCRIDSLPPAVANKYFGRPEGTMVVLKRFASGWFLTEAFRAYCEKESYGRGREIRLGLSDEAKANIPNNWQL